MHHTIGIAVLILGPVYVYVPSQGVCVYYTYVVYVTVWCELLCVVTVANVGDYSIAEHKAGYSLDFLKLLHSNVDQLPSRYEFSLIELHKEHQ